jgi:hypothetical protein
MATARMALRRVVCALPLDAAAKFAVRIVVAVIRLRALRSVAIGTKETRTLQMHTFAELHCPFAQFEHREATSKAMQETMKKISFMAPS